MSPPVRVVAARSRRVAANGRRQGAHVAEMQRRRLLLALGEVVGEGGLEAANVGRVCSRAGVSRRTFYELFEDREAILLAAFDQAVQRIAEKLAFTYGERERWRDRTRRALYVLLKNLDADPDAARLCVIEVSRAGGRVLDRRRQVLEALAGYVDEGRSETRSGSQPPPLTAQGVIGGVVAVIHDRLLAGLPSDAGERGRGVREGGGPGSSGLVELLGPLMAMIVHPYLGPAAARSELDRPVPEVGAAQSPHSGAVASDPFRGLPIRFTYRTARVLATIARDPGASNRHIADHAGIADEGQTSRLLRRLQDSGLIENQGEGHGKGAPNAWALTARGQAIHATIG